MYFEGDKTSDDTIGIHRMTLSKMVNQRGYHEGIDSLDTEVIGYANGLCKWYQIDNSE